MCIADVSLKFLAPAGRHVYSMSNKFSLRSKATYATLSYLLTKTIPPNTVIHTELSNKTKTDDPNKQNRLTVLTSFFCNNEQRLPTVVACADG